MCKLHLFEIYGATYLCDELQCKEKIDDDDDDWAHATNSAAGLLACKARDILMMIEFGFYVVVCIVLLILSLHYSSAHATNSAAGLLARTCNKFISSKAACVQGKGMLVMIVVYVCIVWSYSLKTKPMQGQRGIVGTLACKKQMRVCGRF